MCECESIWEKPFQSTTLFSRFRSPFLFSLCEFDELFVRTAWYQAIGDKIRFTLQMFTKHRHITPTQRLPILSQ